MSPFNEREVEYLHTQRLGRLATVGRDGSPHVVPVGFSLDEDRAAVEIGGFDFARSRKWANVQRDQRIALVVDDVNGGPRGLEIRGRAELRFEGGELFGGGKGDPMWIRLVPIHIATWGIEAATFEPGGRVSRRV